MKRQWIVAGLVLAAALVAVFLLVRPPGGQRDGGADAIGDERVFASDSLGVRLRLPESPGWALHPLAGPQPDGRVVVARHEADPQAAVSVFVLPTQEGASLEAVFRARQRQMGGLFGVDDLAKAVAHVMRDTTTTCDGDPCRQYQAFSMNAVGPDEKPVRAAFMWVTRLHAGRSYECIGVAWYRTGPGVAPDVQVASEAILNDMAYILQSFEVR